MTHRGPFQTQTFCESLIQWPGTWSTGEAWALAPDTPGKTLPLVLTVKRALLGVGQLPPPPERGARGFAAGTLSCCPPRRGKHRVPGQSTKSLVNPDTLKASRKHHC